MNVAITWFEYWVEYWFDVQREIVSSHEERDPL